jgi:GTP-binding protein
MSLDDAIDYISDDEFVEVTPKNVRLRKRILDTEERKSHRKARQNGNGAPGL